MSSSAVRGDYADNRSSTAEGDSEEELFSQGTLEDEPAHAMDLSSKHGGHGEVMYTQREAGQASGGEWKTVQRNKRPRTSSNQPHSPAEFEKLSVNGKLSALCCEMGGVAKRLDMCVALHSKVEGLECHVQEQSTRIAQLEYRSLDLEARSRRNNIIIGGIEESRDEDCSVVIADFLKSNLNIDPCPLIPRVHRLGRFQRGKSRPIIAFFLDTRDTERVIRNAKLLRGTHYSINRDYPKEISDARRELWPELKAIRERNPRSLF